MRLPPGFPGSSVETRRHHRKACSRGTGWELGPCANISGILKAALFRQIAAVSENSSMLPCPVPLAQKKTGHDVMRKI